MLLILDKVSAAVAAGCRTEAAARKRAQHTDYRKAGAMLQRTKGDTKGDDGTPLELCGPCKACSRWAQSKYYDLMDLCERNRSWTLFVIWLTTGLVQVFC